MTPRRLYRSHDRQLAGVAGGMADYLDVDPTIVRILWILAGLFSGGLLILAYIILAFVIPQAPLTATPYQGWTAPAGVPSPMGTGSPAWSPDWAARAEAECQARAQTRGRGPGAAAIVGIILVVFGVIALADSLLPGWVGASVFGPGVVLALGAALLVGSLRRNDGGIPAPVGATAARGDDAGGYDAGAVAGYDAEATSTVDLGAPVLPLDRNPDTDTR